MLFSVIGGNNMSNTFEHDATPTWSGFIYQGEIAVYLAVKKICELKKKGINMELIGSEYKLEVEKCEDISIIHEIKGEKEYISIHQVKNQKDTELSKYQNPLVQLMIEKGFYAHKKQGNPDAFLHVSKNICSKDKNRINNKLEQWYNQIEEYYSSYSELTEKIEKSKNDNVVLHQLKELVSSEPIKLERKAYKDPIKIISSYGTKNAKTNDEIKEAVVNLKNYMDNELCISSISKDVKVYVYKDKEDFCEGDKIFQKIVEQVTIYKGDKSLSYEQHEYIADKLRNHLLNHVVERHKCLQNGTKCEQQIGFKEIIHILDDSLENYEREANILALRRKYENQLFDYCNLVCKNPCHDENETSTTYCNINQIEFRKTDLSNKDFVKLCYSLNPNCDKPIENRECIGKLLEGAGMDDCVLNVLQNIPQQYFSNIRGSTKYMINNQDKNALVTAISDKHSSKVIKYIVNAIQNNATLISPIFDADQLITKELTESNAVWDNNYGEIEKSYLYTLDEEEKNQNSICCPKKPEFIKAEDVIKKITETT